MIFRGFRGVFGEFRSIFVRKSGEGESVLA